MSSKLELALPLTDIERVRDLSESDGSGGCGLFRGADARHPAFLERCAVATLSSLARRLDEIGDADAESASWVDALLSGKNADRVRMAAPGALAESRHFVGRKPGDGTSVVSPPPEAASAMRRAALDLAECRVRVMNGVFDAWWRTEAAVNVGVAGAVAALDAALSSLAGGDAAVTPLGGGPSRPRPTLAEVELAPVAAAVGLRNLSLCDVGVGAAAWARLPLTAETTRALRAAGFRARHYGEDDRAARRLLEALDADGWPLPAWLPAALVDLPVPHALYWRDEIAHALRAAERLGLDPALARRLRDALARHQTALAMR